MKRVFFYSIASVATFVSTSEIGRANDQAPNPVGLLTCDVTSQISDVLKSKQDVACRYIRSSNQRVSKSSPESMGWKALAHERRRFGSRAAQA